jgi:hypothetical protein
MTLPGFPFLDFDDLFEGRGTAALGYRASTVALDGGSVAIAGFVVPVHGREDRFLLVDVPGACPDCSAAPVPALALAGFHELPRALATEDTRVVLSGRLGVGFAIDADGDASYLRLHDARLLA